MTNKYRGLRSREGKSEKESSIGVSLDDPNSPLHEPLPPTSVTNPSTVVQNFLPQDRTSSGLITAVGAQPSVVMNLAAIQPQMSVAAQLQTTVAGVAVNLNATVNPTTAVSTAISTAQPYIPPWRRPHANLHQTLDHNLNAGGLRQDGAVRATTVASAATAGNVLQPPNAYLAANAPIGNPFNQVIGAQRNLSHRYSTEWETQLVQELSADEEDLKRIQARINAKRAALATGTGDPSTSTPNPNLSAQPQANLNPYVQPVAPTSGFTVPQPWLMSGYAAPLPAALYGAQYGAQYGRPVGGTVT